MAESVEATAPGVSSYRSHFRETLTLALPIVVGRLGQMTTGLADNIMVGRLGAAPLAGASFSIGIFMIIVVFGVGMSLGVTPLVASSHGEGRFERMPSYITNGLSLNVLIGILLCGLAFGLSPFMRSMGQPPEVAELAIPYFRILGASMVPFMVFLLARQYAEGLSLTKYAMFITLAGNALNILLNWFLIFGNWGFPELGLNGAGWATLSARTAMGGAMLGYLFIPSVAKRFNVVWEQVSLSLDVMKRILRLGGPIGLQLTFELSAFSGAAILVGWIGTKPLAAHQIALILTATSFMAASGFAASGTVRVGHQRGARNLPELRRAGWSIFLLVGGFMLLTSLAFLLFREGLPRIFIQDPEVAAIATGLLVVVGIFQLPDGLQVVGISNLRGLGDVWGPTLIAFTAYWVCGIPAGYLLAFKAGWGAIGVWMGLLVGLSVAAILLNVRFFRKTRSMERIME